MLVLPILPTCPAHWSFFPLIYSSCDFEALEIFCTWDKNDDREAEQEWIIKKRKRNEEQFEGIIIEKVEEVVEKIKTGNASGDNNIEDKPVKWMEGEKLRKSSYD